MLSSKIHVVWALANGGTLEDRPRYNKSRCFETFPFPALEEGALKQRIRDLGERLDAHRKRQQEAHPGLTLTGIYNVLEKLRSGETLNAKDKIIHEQGLVSVLKQIHDDLDAAVFEAYGWADLHRALTLLEDFQIHDWITGTTAVLDADPKSFDQAVTDHRNKIEQAILSRLVALNHERAAEEKRGLIRWLRPEFQAPGAATAQQSEIGLSGGDSSTPATAAPVILAWPDELPAQVAAVRKLLPSIGQDPEFLAACFGRKSKKRTDQITGILATLKSLGHIA